MIQGATWNGDRFENILRTKISGDVEVLISPGNHDLCPYYGSPGSHHLRSYLEVQARWCPGLVTAEGHPLGRLTEQAKAEVAAGVKKRAQAMQARFVRRRLGPPPLPITQDPAWLPPGWTPGMIEDMDRRRRDYEAEVYKEAIAINWRERARRELINEWCQQRWYDLFPLQLRRREEGLMVLILNSVIWPMKTIGASALGRLGQDQITRVTRIIDKVSVWARTVLIVMHHAPFRRENELGDVLARVYAHPKWAGQIVSELQEFALLAHAVREAKAFLRSVSNAAERNANMRIVLCCGHRHRAATGRFGEIIILEGGALAEDDPTAWLLFTIDGAVRTEKLRLL